MTIKTFFKTTLGLAALLLGSSAALAECPTGMGDTGDSVYMSFDDFYVRFDRLADGSVIEDEVYLTDGTGFRVHSVTGAFVLQSWDTRYGGIVQGSSETTTYAVGVDALPTLFPGQTWSGSTVRQHEDGTTNVETVAVQVDGEITLLIGDCSYQAWPMLVTTTGTDGAAFLDRLTYLPSLGFAIYHGGADAGEPFTPEQPMAISTEPPMLDNEGNLIFGGGMGQPMPGNPTPAAPPGAPAPGGNK
ncbi:MULTISPECIES: hypothetical protein [Rhodobacterales]|uniref:hypothetical protein n=1 Tax=Rhodobacterales TaxID=204455 RepID=UPI003510E1F5